MKNLFLFLIKFYRKYLSPLKSTKCPYFPSCSQYGLEAVERYGAVKGGLLSIWRILRCNPFSKGGYDPVPSINYNKDYSSNYNGQDRNRKEKSIKTFYRF